MAKFRYIRQRDTMQCGAACLAMVLEAMGMRRSLEEVSARCSPTTEGVSLLALGRVAEGYGLMGRGVRITLDELRLSPLPAILHWNQNHFVVLYAVSKAGKFCIADPGKGLVKCDVAEFRRHWESTSSGSEEKGIAMLFEKTPEFDRIASESMGDKRDERRSFGFLAGYVKQYRRYFFQIFLGLLLGCLLQLVMPFLTQAIVDVGIHRRDIGLVWLILLGELMIVAGRTATDFIRRWLLLHISMRINISLVSDFFIKLLRLPMSFFESKLLGDLMQRMSDHSRVQNFLTSQMLGVLFTVLSFVVFGIVLCVYDPLVFLVFLVGSIVYGVWIAMFLSRRKVIDYELFEQQAIGQNRTFRFLTTMQEIKLQDCEKRRRWEWEDAQAGLFDVQMKSLRLQQTQEAGGVFINEIKNILITVIAATAVIDGRITLGAMLAIQYIVGQLNSPVEQLMGFIYAMQDVRISLERINEIHCGKDEEPDSGRLTDMCLTGCGISMDNVDFRYDPHAPDPILKDVTLKIPEGKVTAIVGASGSGKSTLVKLMLGYYAVQKGAVNIGGRPIGDYSMRWWRRQCGVVMQDGVIFTDSIARNIAACDGDVDTVRLEEAARTACIHDYIMSLPLKYNTIIGPDGVGLSLGQKQRILIARAVYRNPRFIFLDEATNSLDARNERRIVENLARFYRGRTVVVVAHRLSTVRDADNIVVLDSGCVAETGTHESLTSRRGTYYTLVKNQLELGDR